MQRKKYIYKKISDLVWVWGSLKWIEVLLQEDEIQYCCMLVMSHYHHIYSSILSIQRKKILHKKQYNYNWYIAFLLLLVKSNLKPNWNIWSVLQQLLCTYIWMIIFTQKPPGGRLLCPECGEWKVSANIWRAAKLVLRGCEHLTI